jgi:hypothetical protein
MSDASNISTSQNIMDYLHVSFQTGSKDAEDTNVTINMLLTDYDSPSLLLTSAQFPLHTKVVKNLYI